MEAGQGLTGWSLEAASKQLSLIISWQDRKVFPGSDLKSAEEGTTVFMRGPFQISLTRTHGNTLGELLSFSDDVIICH